jgi:hypothetical protein
MPRSLSLFFVVFFFICPNNSYAQVNNQLTLTSYYPVPFGAYDRLRLVPRAHLGGVTNACTAPEEGTLYIDKDNGNIINQCRSLVWVPISSGLWDNRINAFQEVEQGPVTVKNDTYFLTKAYPNLRAERPYVGIGTNSPKAPLHVVRNTNTWAGPPTLILENTSTNNPSVGILFKSFMANTAGATLDEVAKIHADYSDALINPISHLDIWLRDNTAANKNILTRQFAFYGTGKLSAGGCATASLLCFNAKGLTGNIAGAVPYFVLNSDVNTAGDILIVDSFGRVGINQTTPTEKLEVNGNVKASGLYLNSDANLKEDIQPVDHALEKISELNGVTFAWKADTAAVQKKHMGVIAQDVEKIFPDSVTGTNGKKSVDYPSLIAPLIEAVKELKNQNQEQDSLIRMQQEEIRTLQDALKNR